MSNPWAAEIPEGTLISILSAQGCHGNMSESDIADNPSLKIIAALKEISSLSEQIHAAEVEVLNRNLHRDNKELVSLESMGRIQSAADEVAQSITMILDNRESLVERVRAPHDDGRLVIEARYQKYTVATFEQLGKVLSQLTVYIGNVEKYKNSRLSEGNIEQSAKQIIELSNTLRTLYDNFRSEHKNLLSIKETASQRCTLQI